MGARLVAASIPLYALGVAIAVFLPWQPSFRYDSAGSLYWGGIFAFFAIVVLAAGAAAARAFSRRLVLTTAAVTVAIIAAYVVWGVAGGSGTTAYVWLFYLAALVWFVLAQAALVVYPMLLKGLWRPDVDLASPAVQTAAPIAIGVLLAPIVLAPRYISDAGEERNWAVLATASLLALLGGLAIAVGIPTVRLPWRSIQLATAMLVVLHVALAIRGLPNPPMALAKAPLLTIEYPTHMPELASDAPIFSDRLALIVHRSGSTLPGGGVYVRYRWDSGPDDPPPPKDVLVWTAAAEGAQIPAHRLRNFAEKVTLTLIPEPLPRSGSAHDAWLGYIEWIFAPDTAAARDRLVTVCEWLVNKQQHISGIEAAPYVRLESEQGVGAAQALYARSLQAPPDRKQWDALVSNGCVYVLAHR